LGRAVDPLDLIAVVGHARLGLGDLGRQQGDLGWLEQVTLEDDRKR